MAPFGLFGLRSRSWYVQKTLSQRSRGKGCGVQHLLCQVPTDVHSMPPCWTESILDLSVYLLCLSVLASPVHVALVLFSTCMLFNSYFSGYCIFNPLYFMPFALHLYLTRPLTIFPHLYLYSISCTASLLMKATVGSRSI